MEKVKIEDLKPGDLIYIAWSDAWEADKIPLSNKDYDAVWHEWGVFLFIRGRRKRHLIMAYNKKPGDITQWDFTAIPTDLILEVQRIQPHFLQKILPGLIEKLLSKANSTVPKRLSQNKNRVLRWSVESLIKLDSKSPN
ncbi:MAG TPA: hypothetical protein ENG10_03270 [Candidatus Bathyarchaeota archaeon]|nr:hypothetical protein [Candidatus Bathyarchaeota archaeon]HEX69298.1 hypothetical protein [Candidatus Bathyarchaeota archaeon]